VGYRVRAVSRTPTADLPGGVEPLAADPDQTRTACAGATVVYHCAQPPYERWAAQFPPLTQSIADAAAAAGARLVYADNLYAYGPVDGPITEDLPTQPTTNKGRIPAVMAERLLAAHRSGTLKVAIGRSSDYYGPDRPTASLATSCSAPPSRATEPAGWAAWMCRTACTTSRMWPWR